MIMQQPPKRPRLTSDTRKPQLEELANVVWAKLSSITPQQTKNLATSKLKLRGCEYRIGRSELSDLQIVNPLISGHHATIWRSECQTTGQMVVELQDLSTNGTYLNGMLVSSRRLTNFRSGKTDGSL